MEFTMIIFYRYIFIIHNLNILIGIGKTNNNTKILKKWLTNSYARDIIKRKNTIHTKHTNNTWGR